VNKSHLSSPKQTLALVTIGLGLLGFLALLFLVHWRWYWAWWSSFSMVTFLAYGVDKMQAGRERGQRVPEVVLHLLAFAGGVVGAWVGRLVFRHKTCRMVFTFVLVLATALHFLLWYLVLK
jgi:uncharacterized membrane protein YsdA (DUF1294 family)